MVKLNLGCGIWLHKGYINVDKFYDYEDMVAKKPPYQQAIVEKGAKYVKADILHLPFKDDYADWVEMHQVMEHFSWQEAIAAMKEINRVMKPGATLLVSTPNFNGLIVDWLKDTVNNLGNKFDLEKFVYRAQEFYGNQLAAGESHRCPITPDFVRFCLGAGGFTTGTMWVFPRDISIPTKGYGLLTPYGDNSIFRSETLVFKVEKPQLSNSEAKEVK